MVQYKDLVIHALVLFLLFECSLSLEEKPVYIVLLDQFDVEKIKKVFRKTKKWMRNKIDGLPKNLMEDVLVKSLEGEKKTDDGPPQVNNLSEMTNQQSPCQKKHCGAGRVCKLTENGEAECVCISDCPVETEDRRKVCSNYNQTWGSDCEIHRMRCNCEEKSEKCSNPEFSHLHVEYYGACKQLSACSDSEMADFPRRMREWLYHIMQDLADREELSPHFKNKMNDAETNMTKLWSNAAVWKWCDLDGYPHDRAVSRHELFPIRAPLMYLEHCIAPFLNKCDANSDHMVTLEEWGNCLEIPKETLEDECDDLRQELN